MKSVYKIFAVILAAGLTIMSCDKKPINEDIPVVNPEGGDNGTEQDATTRVITLSFDTKATRTVLGDDGITPMFKQGDLITVAKIDANASPKCTTEVCTVSVNNGVATTTTHFSGKLKAVYPEKYAQVVDDDLTFFVPSDQTGLFEDANICMATIPDGSNPCAVFENQTAIFVIDFSVYYDFDACPDPVLGVNEVTVTSLGKIQNGLRGSNKSVISSDSRSKNRISIPLAYDYYDFPIFISVLCDANDPVLLADLSFNISYDFYSDWENDYYEDGIHPRMLGGFSPYFLDKKFGQDSYKSMSVYKNAIYTGVEDHLHGYANTGNLTWSTEYLGPEGDDTSEIGYFSWGATTGHRWNEDESMFEPKSGDSGYAFKWDNCLGGEELDDAEIAQYCLTYNDANKHQSYKILSLEYDAAYINWGGPWRMPRTSDEQEFEMHYSSTGDNTYTISNSEYPRERGPVTFYPVGYSDDTNGTSLTGTITQETPYPSAIFWSSTLKEDDKKAYYCTFSSNGEEVELSNGDRKIGHTIRPVVGRGDL